MAEWFEDWFNTEEYLNVYRHRNNADARALVKLILKNIDIPADAKVLDLACGAGRHSILFAQKGYNVTAVDLSENLLRVAKRISDRAGEKINFVKADLRNFCVENKFHLAVNLFTSFGYFKDDKENFSVFRDAYNQLFDDGFFVIDYFNKNYIINNIVPITEEEISKSKIIQRRKIIGNRVVKTITIKKNGTEKEFIESVRMYNEYELSLALNSVGFNILYKFGDFEGNKFDLETSPRIIIITRK